MKALLIASLLFSSSALFAQYEMYSGTIEGSLFNDGKYRLNSEDSVFFIQGNKVYKTTTKIGKFYLDFKFSFEEPFYIHFTNPYCVRKIVYFDLSTADTSFVLLNGESRIQFPKIKMDMIPNYKGEMFELSVANFYWRKDRLVLDLQHAKDQNELLDRFKENPGSLFIDSLFSIDIGSPLLKVGDIYRPKENIHFSKDKAEIHKSSLAELDSIALFAMEHPNFIIEVGTHVDARSSDDESNRLDQIRATNVQNYLISKGVDSMQLKSVGHWKYQPIISEITINSMNSKKEKEEAHQINSRTEFKIISVSRRF